jgi:NAD(P)-dependent dehydrogenase (short-subunit alcohol dehydrogenase family)
MELNLKGRTALVTGGSAGIGYAVAEEFAREGVNLHLAARTKSDLEKVEAELEGKYGVEVTIHAVDLSDRAKRDALARECAGVDILVNNAGAVPGGDIFDVDEDTWRATWELKQFGYVGITRIIYKAMCERRSGVIINVVGTGGILTSADYICGGLNNRALIQFTTSLGGASVRYGVRVCGVNPGPTETRRLKTLRKAREEKAADPEAFRRELFAKYAFGRPAHADEISAMVAFLASDRASYMSGCMMTVDGGAVARGGTL